MSEPVATGRIVVVGGGVAGVATVAALRAGGYDGELTLVERGGLPYDRPPLSKDYLSGARDLARLALHPLEWYHQQHIELICRTDVVAIAPHPRSVGLELSDGRHLTADQVVLATGGRASLPPITGLPEVDAAGLLHRLRDVEHADRLRAALTPGAGLLVVGGGLIGAEVASTALSLGCRVTLVDPLDPPFAAAGLPMATWLHAEHGRRGVDVRTTAVDSLTVEAETVLARLADGSTVRSDAVLIGVGMTATTELAEAAGIQTDRGVLVDSGRRTSHPRVLAVGDTARRHDRPPAEHWEAAQRDGECAAASLLQRAAPDHGAGWWWTDRHDVHVEGVGTMREDDDHAVVVRGDLSRPPFSTFTLHGGRVVGAVAVDDPNAVRAARRLIDRGISVDADQLTDTTVDLRALLKGARR